SAADAGQPGAGEHRHTVDLDQHPGQRETRAHGGPGRQRPWERARVNLVHGGEVPHVREEHTAPDHVGQARTGRLKDGREGAEGDPGLLRDAGPGQGPVLKRALPRHVHEAAFRDDPRGVRARWLAAPDRLLSHGHILADWVPRNGKRFLSAAVAAFHNTEYKASLRIMARFASAAEPRLAVMTRAPTLMIGPRVGAKLLGPGRRA